MRLNRKDTAPIRLLVEGWMVADSSFGMPLPKPLPLIASNVLKDAIEPIFAALNGEIVPNESPASASTSSATSPEVAAAPPVLSEPAPSGMPSGS